AELELAVVGGRERLVGADADDRLLGIDPGNQRPARDAVRRPRDPALARVHAATSGSPRNAVRIERRDRPAAEVDLAARRDCDRVALVHRDAGERPDRSWLNRDAVLL